MRNSVAIPPVAAVRPRLPYLKTFVLITAQLALVVVLCWFCLPQAVGGRAGWVLVSGTSMLPHYHTGDLVLVERRSKYHLGEVIAYRIPQATVGAGHVVIHRIVGGSGKTGWKMQGDNRTAPDLWYPKKRDIIGAEELRIPHAWFVLRILHMPILLGLFAASAAFFLIALAGDGKADSEGEDTV
jgi:signal peptidase I